jgi:hypothetical protein
MSNWITDFFDEFVPIATAALGIETPPEGSLNVITAIQGIQHNMIAMLNDRAGKGWNLSLPALFIDVGDFSTVATELGMSVLQQKRAPVTIVYIADLGGTNSQDFCYSQIIALQKVIEDPTKVYHTFAYMEQGDAKSSYKAPLNNRLMSNSQGPTIAAALIYTPGLLAQTY